MVICVQKEQPWVRLDYSIIILVYSLLVILIILILTNYPSIAFNNHVKH